MDSDYKMLLEFLQVMGVKFKYQTHIGLPGVPYFDKALIVAGAYFCFDKDGEFLGVKHGALGDFDKKTAPVKTDRASLKA